MANYIISYLIMVVACASLGTSLRCYECKSPFNGECDNVRGRNTAEEDCEHSKLLKAFHDVGDRYVCVIHKMPQKDDRELSVVRGCAPNNYCSRFEQSTLCVTCAEDLCNTSSAVLPSIILSTISFLIAKCYF